MIMGKAGGGRDAVKRWDNWMQCQFDSLCDSTEWLLSRWWGALIYIGFAFVLYATYLWDGIDRYTYLTGNIILVLLVGAGRRDSKASHAREEKTIELLGGDEEMQRLEERSEIEIEAVRNCDRADDNLAGIEKGEA